MLNNVLSAIPQSLGREEWLQALPRALVAGFVKTDIEFQQQGMLVWVLFAEIFFVWCMSLIWLVVGDDRGDFWNDSYVCCD